MDEAIKKALEFEKLATDDALSLISVEANDEVSRFAEARIQRGEAPAKHETLRVRLEELEKEIRMRVEQRRICSAQYPALLEENQLEDLRVFLHDRIDSRCNQLQSLVSNLGAVPSRTDQRKDEAPRLKETADRLITQLQLMSRKQSASSDQPLIFISCGQFSEEERALGKSAEVLIRERTGFAAYFAENQNSLQGLSENIFDALKRATGFVAIMHHRGNVTTPIGTHTRGSVWIEQEIAIAAFLRFLTGRTIPVLLYLQRGADGVEIKREGLREQLRLDPITFTNSEDVLNDLRMRIASGHLHTGQASASKRAGRDEARYQKAKAAIEKHGTSARIVLRHLQNVGQFRMGTFFDDPAPKGVRGEEMRDMLTKLQEEELLAVSVIDGRAPSRTFRIAPGMVEAVDQLV